MTRRPWASFAVIVAALLLVALAAHGTGVQWSEGHRNLDGAREMAEPEPLTGDFEPPEMPSEFVPTDEESTPLPSWISWLVLGILIGVPAALLLGLLLRRLTWWLADTSRLPTPTDLEQDHRRSDIALVEHALTESLAEIDLGTDPRSAIIACWVRLETAAEHAGTPREPSDTPADLVTRLLATHHVDNALLSRLSGSYLRARYSPHEVTEQDRDDARGALRALGGQLGAKEAR